MTISEPIRAPKKVVYPVSDGKPMAETDIHRDGMNNTISGLKYHFRDRSDVYVSGNNIVYFEEGDNKKCVSPDTYVVFGVPSKLRDCYFIWKEGGRSPDVVIEFTSRKTRREDKGKKYHLYEKVLKVKEYFQFDPRGDYLNPRLQGFRLNQAGDYEPIELLDGRMLSEMLGLELVVEGQELRLYDPRKGEFLPVMEEVADRARYEAAARRRAEREARAEMESRQKAEHEVKEQQQRAEEQQQRAEEQQRRADREAQARHQAEEELQRMRAELDALRRQSRGN